MVITSSKLSFVEHVSLIIDKSGTKKDFISCNEWVHFPFLLSISLVMWKLKEIQYNNYTLQIILS